MPSRVRLLLPLLVALAACGERETEPTPPPRDPQVAQALDDPLMTDPDLSSRNEAASALTVESDASLPILPATAEAIAAARADAARIAGGADRLVAPGDPEANGVSLANDANPRDRLAVLGAGADCLRDLQASAIWAARMPAAMPVYPRGATLDAAGSDSKACKVRAITFSTPVPPADVLAFYAHRARAANIASRYLRAGQDLQLTGRDRSFAFDVRVRPEGDHTIVRLTTLVR
ncbi:hypothetical protein N0B51_12675 [Tsuneonella sp. YG55]|uniref:Lipoprotein n=1 Tax=Tsuneonella litorea TaxID=2976475 RepID=A0A9X3A8U2_9SPHN|nr:hypothetical protein [Tsuneonella litorea]MCT2559831.1 hypothetical protein [Tsuneonella litorea]